MRVSHCALLAFFAFCFDSFAGAPNLLKNGGFEDGAPSKAFVADGTADSFARSGSCSLLISSDGAGKMRELRYAEKVPLRPGVHYAFSSYFFVESSAPDSVRVTGRAAFFDKDGKIVKHIFPEAAVQTGAWLPFKFDFYTPVGAESVSLTLWFGGKGTVRWDDISFSEEPQEAPAKCACNYRFSLFESDAFLLWKEMPNVKIPFKGSPESLASGPLEISCAKNESEPFMLVFTPKRDLEGVSLEFSDLTSPHGKPIPKTEISCSRVGFIDVKNPDDPAMKGMNADPLIPGSSFNLKAGENSPAWISVAVPQDAASGLYSGRISVVKDGKTLASIPLSVKVRSFALPEQPSLATGFYSRRFPNQMGQFDKRQSESEVIDDIYSILKRHRITGNQSYGAPLPKWEFKDGRLTVVDWSAFDAFVVEKMTKYNIRWFTVGGLGFYGDNSGWGCSVKDVPVKLFGLGLDTKEGKAALKDYVRQLGAHLKEKGWLDLCHSYIWDEPPDPKLKTVAELCDVIHGGEPKLDIFVSRKITPELVGKVNTWCLPFAPGYIDMDKIKARRAAGDKMWIYNWTVRLDDYGYINNRLFPWFAYMIDADGALLWQTLYAAKGANPWTDMDKVGFNGGATLLYPDPSGNGPYIDSQRFALVKESIDDFDYFKLLESRIDSIRKGWGKDRVKEIIGAIIYDAPFNYKNDPSLLYRLRDEIADEMESLDVKPLLLVRTAPAGNSVTLTSAVSVAGVCEPGAKVFVNGEAIPPSKSGEFSKDVQLASVGENLITVKAELDGKSKTVQRHIVFKRDPNLDALGQMLEKAKGSNVDLARFKAAYDKAAKGSGYSESSKGEVEKALAGCRRAILVHKLESGAKDPANQVYAALLKRASWALENGLLDSAERYLDEARKLDPGSSFAGASCSIEPANVKGHFGFILKNALIEATILESGARIIDFKAGGVPCLRMGNLDADFPERIRADFSECKKTMLVNNGQALGGYEDASAIQRPDAYADWKMSIVKLSPDEISIAGEVGVDDGKFLLKRTMTIKKGDPRLQIKYDIRNTEPAGFKSDDPHAYDFPWRGHADIGIGASASGGGDPEGDTLVVPSDVKLPCETFSKDNGVCYEMKTLPLNANYAASFDAKERTAFAQIFDPSIKNLYVWFHSGESAHGAAKEYTLEPNVAIGVKPFILEPGCSVSFTGYFAGFGDVASKDGLLKKLEQYRSRQF